MARIYTNENFPLKAVEALRNLGHDILTTLEAGNANQSIPDEGVIAFAIQQERILVTLNRKHFIKLHQVSPTHPGIVVCTFDPNPDALAGRISEAIQLNEPVTNKLIRVNRTG